MAARAVFFIYLLLIQQCNAIALQAKSSSDASMLQIKHEPGTPTYDEEDSMSSMDVQIPKVCLTAM